MNNDLEFINIEIDSGVCTVTMNRLEKKNAINPQFAIAVSYTHLTMPTTP